MRRAALSVLLAAAIAFAGFVVPLARADWRSEQPVAAGIGVPVPLGKVGDIEFWAPNRGLLITEGNKGMPAGLYAYDGTGWRLYSTVCGGHEGRIAWAGPAEFWTVSDYAMKPEGLDDGSTLDDRRTLCHFKDGQVVASYAEPFGTAEAYLPMNAAACAGPSNCWFAGERLSGDPNVGAFHLHWNGQDLRAAPSLISPEPELEDPGRTVADLAFHEGRLYESVQVQTGDGQVPGEPDPAQPSFLHLVDLGATQPFAQLFTDQPLSYGAADGSALSSFRFTALAGQIWAVAGASAASNAATVTVVRSSGPNAFAQLPLSPNATFGPGDKVPAAAAEPGAGRIWVSLRHPGEGTQVAARVAAIGADGSVEPPHTLPAEDEGIGPKGPAGPIACPALGQCWLATDKGWLFHLGGPLPQDTDPAMHALITHRPPDDSTPFVPPVELPVDDSGSELPLVASPEERGERPRRRPRPRKLVTAVRQKVVDRSVLELSFLLRARAHVRLIAKRKRRIVAQTPRRTMGKGRHVLRLRLDPERWPTSLDFQVHAARGKAG